MEISQEEYQTLKAQLAELQERVSGFEKPEKRNQIRAHIKDKPITGISANNYDGNLHYCRTSSGVWELFIGIGKELVKDSPKFTERKGRSNYERGKYNYFDDDTIARKRFKKLITDYTEEEFDAVVSMTNAMSEIYNQYYKKLHSTAQVNFKEMEAGNFKSVEVLDN